MNHRATTYDATFRLLEALEHGGLGRFVISPGSRSTALALCANELEVPITVVHDERAAGFFALGWARATGMAAGLVCTSGTAAANYLPAIIEAKLARIPLVIITADRPPEVRGFGAGQTIDQVKLYGDAVHEYRELPVMSECGPDRARLIGTRAIATAIDQSAPVHLNVPYREPLTPEPTWSAPAPSRPISTVAAETTSSNAVSILRELATQTPRGLIVAGPSDMSDSDAQAVLAFARHAQWPIIAEPSSQLRTGMTDGDPIVFGADYILRNPTIATEMAPDVVVRLGGALASRVLREWLAETSPWRRLLLNPTLDWSDPAGTTTDIIRGPLFQVFHVDRGDEPLRTSSPWNLRWSALSETFRDVAAELPEEMLTAQSVIEAVSGSLADGDGLFVSSSMPVRDLDIFSGPITARVRVGSNRGANGIDGVTSSAIGFSSGLAARVTLLIGDIAFLHDFGGLLACGTDTTELSVVVVDDNGGGIFSRLPAAREVDASTFARLFTAPHGRDLHELCLGAGFSSRRAVTRDELDLALGQARADGGLQIVHTALDAAANFAHAETLASRLMPRLS